MGVVADVVTNEEMLAARFIQQGLARKYDGGRRQGWCSTIILTAPSAKPVVHEGPSITRLRSTSCKR